jgi:ferredoxin
MKVIVDQDLCIGCGNCAAICPAVFSVDQETNTSVVIDPEGCDLADCCEAAEENCPVEAITLEQ